jgi:hypothetical protein
MHRRATCTQIHRNGSEGKDGEKTQSTPPPPPPPAAAAAVVWEGAIRGGFVDIILKRRIRGRDFKV